jgi:hypothetical protein
MRLSRVMTAALPLMIGLSLASCGETAPPSPLAGWIPSKSPMCAGVCAQYDRVTPPGTIWITEGVPSNLGSEPSFQPVKVARGTDAFMQMRTNADGSKSVSYWFTVGTVEVEIEGKGVDASGLRAFAEAVPLPGL